MRPTGKVGFDKIDISRFGPSACIVMFLKIISGDGLQNYLNLIVTVVFLKKYRHLGGGAHLKGPYL
jgi:hypothetical protein